MHWSKYTGTHFLTRLTDSERHALLVVGRDRFSYQQIADLGIIQPRSCRILSRIALDFKATSVTDLYAKTSPYLLAGTRGVGVTTLYVLLKVYRAQGLSVDGWYQGGDGKQAVRTFDTLKAREQKAEKRTIEAERKRRRLRSRHDVTQAAAR